MPEGYLVQLFPLEVSHTFLFEFRNKHIHPLLLSHAICIQQWFPLVCCWVSTTCTWTSSLVCSGRSLSRLGWGIARFLWIWCCWAGLWLGSCWQLVCQHHQDSGFCLPRQWVACNVFLPCFVEFHSRNYHRSRLLFCLLSPCLCESRRWCLFPLLCLLPLGQGVRICWRLRWTISLCVWVLWSVAYIWGTVWFCCRKQVRHVWNISAVGFACEFAVWFRICNFLIHWFVVLAFFAQSMVPLLHYLILIWLGRWGLVCQQWLWWWLGEVISPLELVSHWAPLELGADCWLICWVQVFPLVVWPFCQRWPGLMLWYIKRVMG
jgi:hypothetical protein